MASTTTRVIQVEPWGIRVDGTPVRWAVLVDAASQPDAELAAAYRGIIREASLLVARKAGERDFYVSAERTHDGSPGSMAVWHRAVIVVRTRDDGGWQFESTNVAAASSRGGRPRTFDEAESKDEAIRRAEALGFLRGPRAA